MNAVRVGPHGGVNGSGSGIWREGLRLLNISGRVTGTWRDVVGWGYFWVAFDWASPKPVKNG